jgi:hypothetical protein
MRTVKDGADAVQSHPDARSPSFRHLGSAPDQKSLNIAPRDTRAYRVG